MQVLNHDKIDKTNNCERSEYHGLLDLCYAYLREVVFENNPSDHETSSIQCHVAIHIDFTYILHSHTPLLPPSSIV